MKLEAEGARHSSRPPNIILIMADDLGIEGLGCYGGESYDTPCLDKMAESGLRFTHAYAQPLCTPTRIQLMTGKYNHRNWVAFGILDPKEKTFGHVMQEAGYRTCIAGKWQLHSYDPPDFPGAEGRRGIGMHPKDAGFDRYSLFHSLHTEDKGSRYANPTFLRDGHLHKVVDGQYGEDTAVEYIEEFLERNREDPMFIYYPMALPHHPFQPTPISNEWQNQSARLDTDLRYFGDMVKYMDRLVGRIIEKVESLGLAQDTLILFYSDNGTDPAITSRIAGVEVKGGKGTTREAGIRVPLIAYWPGRIETGVCDAIVDASDFLPTFAELGRGEIGKDCHIDGCSFARQLFGHSDGGREWAFFWYDPRPGHGKRKFSREIFALNREYKVYSDGRIARIHETLPLEDAIPEGQLGSAEKAARDRLLGVIDSMMQPPLSEAATRETDENGRPVALDKA